MPEIRAACITLPPAFSIIRIRNILSSWALALFNSDLLDGTEIPVSVATPEYLSDLISGGRLSISMIVPLEKIIARSQTFPVAEHFPARHTGGIDRSPRSKKTFGGFSSFCNNLLRNSPQESEYPRSVLVMGAKLS